MRELDPQLAIFNVQQTDDRVSRSAAQPRLNAGLVSMFAVVAGLLSALGIYGVLASLVSQARHEVGIRLALGAARRSIMAIFLRRAAWLGTLGLATGLACAYVLSSAMQSQVYGVSIRDPFIYLAAAVLVGMVVLAAAVIPAGRAAGVDPLTALRE